MDALIVEISAEGVAIVTMDDERTNNALSHAIVSGLGEAFAAVARNPDVRCVVLTGRDEMFSSGASREVIDDLTSGRRDSSELLLPRLLLDCPVPCIAAMAGSAVGGGFALAIAADIVLMARESRYCLNFMDLGFTPGMGTTRLLEHVLSPALAHELLYSGEARRGRDFEGRAGINYILPRVEVMPKALDLAQRIAEKPRVALTALKRVLSAPRRMAFEAARTDETLMHTISFADPGTVQQIERGYGI